MLHFVAPKFAQIGVPARAAGYAEVLFTPLQLAEQPAS